MNSRIFLCLIANWLLVFSNVGAQTQILERSNNGAPLQLEEIPLASTAPPGAQWGFGLADRDADHGSVAINSNRDIVVAFHSTRTETADSSDLPPKGTTNWLWDGTMKQVELAYYKYDQANDRWNHHDTRVMGGVEYNPLFLTQNIVKCERPDVVAVGEKFFVLWTRRYFNGQNWADQSGQPAVLECAWVSWDPASSDFVVSGIEGIGWPIDEHVPGSTNENEQFEIKECAGVADAVALYDPQDPDKHEVAVVYPHQTKFSSGADLDRTFDLRVATCKLVGTNISVTKSPLPLYPSIKFNGPPTPAGEPSPGLILPELAPSNEKDAFWIVHERQKMVEPDIGLPKEPDGRIRLEYYQLIAGDWESQASKLFKSSPIGSGSPLYWRRRPVLSSYTKGVSDTVVSIAFGKVNSYPRMGDITANIVYEHWEYDNNNLISPPTLPGLVLTADWPNQSTLWDDRPAPLQGRHDPLTWRCYATRMSASPTIPESAPADLMGFDPNPPGTLEFLAGNNAWYKGIQRPATAYFYDDAVGAVRPDYFVVTWEQRNPASERRVFINVD